MSINHINGDIKRIGNLMNLTFGEKQENCVEIEVFFNRFCEMHDISFDIWENEGDDLPYFMCSLSVKNFLEVQSSILSTAYNSVGQMLRWLYEANLAGAAGCINPSLLDTAYSCSQKLTGQQFSDWLSNYDDGKSKFREKKFWKIAT